MNEGYVRQLHWWLSRTCCFVQVPKAWREELRGRHISTGRSKLHHSVTAEDGTRKFLLQLHDGLIVEAVGIPADDANSSRLTACVSSQVVLRTHICLSACLSACLPACLMGTPYFLIINCMPVEFCLFQSLSVLVCLSASPCVCDSIFVCQSVSFSL